MNLILYNDYLRRDHLYVVVNGKENYYIYLPLTIAQQGKGLDSQALSSSYLVAFSLPRRPGPPNPNGRRPCFQAVGKARGFGCCLLAGVYGKRGLRRVETLQHLLHAGKRPWKDPSLKSSSGCRA